MERKTIGTENLKLIVNILISLVILLLCIFLVPRLVLFFMPFVIGWIISCIANPLVVFLERKLKIKRKAGTVVVIVCVIAAVIGIGYGLGVILWRQISGFIQEIPAMWEAVKQDFDAFGMWIDQYIGGQHGWQHCQRYYLDHYVYVVRVFFHCGPRLARKFSGQDTSRKYYA